MKLTIDSNQHIQLQTAKRGEQKLPAGSVIMPEALLPAGHMTLNDILGGGIPRGRITEIAGKPSSGITSLSLRFAAEAQKEGGLAVFIDGERALAPDYAQQCGVDISRFLLAHAPPRQEQVLNLATDIAASKIAGIIIFSAGINKRFSSLPASHVQRLKARLLNTPTALIFLTMLPTTRPGLPVNSSISPAAWIHLLVERKHWIHHQRDVIGYKSEVTVLRNKSGKSGKSAAVTFLLDSGLI